MEGLFFNNSDIKTWRCSGCNVAVGRRKADNRYFYRCTTCSHDACYECLGLGAEEKRSILSLRDLPGLKVEPL